MSRYFEELKNATEKFGLQYEFLTGEIAAAIIEASFLKFEPFRTQGHLGIMHERSVKLKLSEHEYIFSETLDDELLLVFFES